MNLEAKEWSQPHSPPTTQQYQSAADHHYAQTYPQGPLMHPPINQPTANFLPLGKSDGALPGMASQPTTPRPTAHSPPDRANSTGSYTFHTQPYPSVMARKRGRSDGALFTAAETGPFFSSTKSCDNLYALDRSSLLSVRIQAKFDRGFFLADNDWTCYRRNYFQVSGAFSIHGLSHYYGEHEWQCLVQVDGALYPVQRFLLGLSARVSNSDKKIELVQHTPKRDKGPQMTPMPKAITPGGNLGLSTVGANQSIVTFERIQFKTATANNGKRRAAQQYYVCLMELFAETDKGVQVKVATCQSAPLVVRGRSPGHYSDSHERYEVPLAASMPPLPPTQQTAPPPPPPPPSQSAPQHLPPVSDDRFAFPRPPVTPPNMVPPTSEYSYPYYSSYPSFAPPPPPPPPALSMVMHGNPQPPATPNTSSPSRQYPYMVPSMSSDPSSSETSSPDMYTGEFVHHPATPTEHAPHQGIAIHPSPMEGEWNRQRYNSAPSSSGHDYYPPPPPPALPSPTAQAHYRGNTKYPA